MFGQVWLRQQRSAAFQGDAEAAYRLGLAYETGDPVPPNLGLAREYYLMAARKDHPAAQYNLAALLEDDGETGLMEALDWYRRAADNGDRDAMYRLGLLCERGLDPDMTADRALFWYRKAAELGHTTAIQRVEHLDRPLPKRPPEFRLTEDGPRQTDLFD